MSKSPTKAGDLFRYLSSDLILKFKNDTAGNCLLTRWCHKSELESIKTTDCKDGHIVGCKCLGFSSYTLAEQMTKLTIETQNREDFTTSNARIFHSTQSDAVRNKGGAAAKAHTKQFSTHLFFADALLKFIPNQFDKKNGSTSSGSINRAGDTAVAAGVFAIQIVSKLQTIEAKEDYNDESAFTHSLSLEPRNYKNTVSSKSIERIND